MVKDAIDDTSVEQEDNVPIEVPGFLERSSIVRWFVVCVLILFLFLFLHFHEEYVDVLKLDSDATRYVVAQIDFDFFDEEKTIILREAAIRDINPIYQIDEDEVHRKFVEFERFIRNNPEWFDGFAHSTSEELFRCADVLEKDLLKMRFSDSRTLSKVSDEDFPKAYYQSFIPSSSKPQKLPSYLWKNFRDLIFADQDFRDDTVSFVIRFFKDKKWSLIEDRKAISKLRKNLQGAVPLQYSRVYAGQRLIDKGENVTSRHIEMLQSMKKTLSDRRNLWHPMSLSGSALLALLFGLAFVFYLKKYRAPVISSNRKLSLIVFVIVMTLGFAKATEFILISNVTNFIEVMRYPLFVPFAAIVLSCLMREYTALLVSGFIATILPFGLAIGGVGGVNFFVINIFAAVIAIFSVKSLRKRKELVFVCIKVWLASALVIAGMCLYENIHNDIGFFKEVFTYFIGTGLFMFFTMILVVGVVPLLEFLFKIVTDMTLMEYVDPNNEILRRLAMEAPGTYQHSIVVGMLAETAAVAIGANGLFCRVVALYHDIGKLKYPSYFTENKEEEIDMHQLLTPEESASIIMDHVKDGVAMAKKIGLPDQIINIIREHHGTTMAYYFYHKQEELKGKIQLPLETGEKEFRYQGPKPRSKEAVIIMLADSLAAAARSLDKFDAESSRNLMNKLIKDKEDDGQFENCKLTFEELNIVKESMIKSLVATEHKRVKYPDKNK